jgi:acetate---CoA ligase (ADP-forming)
MVPQYTGKIGFIEYLSILPENGNNPRSVYRMRPLATKNLKRLFSPRSVAFVGGTFVEMAIRRNQELGYDGEIWPVHPTRKEILGFRTYPSVDDLPGVPDAAFVAVKRELTIDIVKKLSDAGVGGCVSYAAGFAEMGDEGRELQDQLVAAAGDMPLVGPNCFGLVNYLDKTALWPYLFGGKQVDRGIALISQSGNIAMNLTMNDRSVNFTHAIAGGNQAVLGQADYIDALLQDDRVVAIGMYVEGVDDLEHFSRTALQALKQGVSIVVLKVGKTESSARQVGSHTSSLTGSDVLYDALFERLGIIRVNSLNRLLETLKVLALGDELKGCNIVSLSCSGGEASIIADAVKDFDIETKPFSDAQTRKLNRQLSNYVTVSNPFDYNTSVWGDLEAQRQCFTTSMEGDHDAAILIWDHPTVDSPEVGEWMVTIDAFIAAHKATGMSAFVVCTISELLPEHIRDKLLAEGIVPLQGLDDALFAISEAAKYREFQANGASDASLPDFPAKTIARDAETNWADEQESKHLLRDAGLMVPEGDVGTAVEAPEIAERVGFPVVVKAVGVLHKSDVGAVKLNLQNAGEVTDAIAQISESAGGPEMYLVERMVTGAIAELIIGINRDDQYGLALVIGAGGILVELIADSVSLLLPTDRNAVSRAIESLSVAKLVKGFRGNEPGDMEAAVDAILSVAKFAESNRDRLMELDINPLLILPAGQGVVAADALMGFSTEDSS